MRRTTALTLSLVLAGAAAAGFLPLRRLPAADVLRQALATVERNVVFPDRCDEAWRQACADAVARAGGLATSEDLSSTLNALLGRLGLSHTRHLSPTEPAFFEFLDLFRRRPFGAATFPRLPGGAPTYVGLGMTTTTLEGGTVVASVYDGGPADRAGILAGDEILDVEGAPFHPLASFLDREGRDTVLRLRHGPGPSDVRMATVRPERLRPSELFLEAQRASARVLVRRGRTLGYVHVWCWADDSYQDLLVEQLGTGPLAGVDGLVLDLRGGWGGADPAYLAPFTDRIPTLTFTDRHGGRFIRPASPPPPPAVRFRAPLVLLVDGGTTSGKEVVAHALAAQGRARIVGTPTAGALLGGRPFLLDDGSLLYLAVTDVTVDGVRLEGRPLEPQVRVERPLRWCRGVDPQVDRAFLELESMVAE